jgi:undecaprenyl-diphosphatase
MRTWSLARSRDLLVSLAVISLLLGSFADFLVGSPGDGSLLFVGFLASAVAALLISPEGPPRIDRHLPAPLRDKPFFAFAFFAFASAAVFAKIAEDVVDRESTGLDQSVGLWVHGLHNAPLDLLMKGSTLVGSFPAQACVVVVLLAWCWMRKDRAAFAGLLAVVAVDETLNRILKNIFDRPRPTIFEEIATLHSYSFPSGHAMAAVANYGMMAVVVGRLIPALKRSAYGGTALLTLLIGVSRIYLGVHWVTDVVAGYVAGATILFGGVLWLEADAASGIARSPANQPFSDRS